MEYLVRKYPLLTKHISSFHPFQEAAINAVLNGNNTLVIAPTGKGKSLIYQIAGQELEGITIVVSPLIALINEQAEFLGDDLALSLNSTLNFAEQRTILRDIANGAYKPRFIFVSPERLQNYFFRAALKKSGLKVSMIVVDEAHCISQWGFDFRPEYSQIDYFITFLHQVGQYPAILAMTATIGRQAQEDIIKEFSIKDSNVFRDHDCIRKELKLHFVEVEEESEKFSEILSIMEEHKPKKALIYFYDKPNCRKIAKKLTDHGFLSETFYSGMDNDDKDKNYKTFKDGNINVLCATSAFGMGMNIPDIDMVIHHRLPDSIEEYYQQVGRAARDKSICLEAKCFAIWSEVNIKYKFDEFISSVKISLDQITHTFKALGLEGESGKAQSMEYRNYMKQNLGRIRYALEKRKVLRTIGELNGTPKSIIFNDRNPYWELIIKKMKFGNSFVRAADNSGIELQQLIDYVFEKELSGEISKFPAMEKKIFFISDYDQVPMTTAFEIMSESAELYDFKRLQVERLSEMIQSDDPDTYILNYFQSQN